MAKVKHLDELRSVVGTAEFPAYLQTHPHVLISSGFDEIRKASLRPMAEILRNAVTTPEAMRNFNFEALPPQAHLPRPITLLRRAASGAWFALWGFHPGRSERTGLPLDTLGMFKGKLDGWRIVLKPIHALKFFEYSADADICLTDDAVASAYRESINAPGPGAIVLPELFRHPMEHPRIELVESARELLRALQQARVELRSLTWQQAEDVVAELLRARGLQISVTPRSKDGGRDLIARGELIPGEPGVLAVEIKHKRIVGLDEISSRMHRNKDFPVLLFVTTGRFTAGVVREKSKPENFMRLLLKDHTALHQWIQAYKM